MSADRDPDKALRFILSVLVASLGVNLLSDWLLDVGWPAAIPPILLVLVVLVTVPRTGLLRPYRQGGTRWTLLLAAVMLAAYLGVGLYAAQRQWSAASMFISLTCLWAACVLLTWQTIAAGRGLAATAYGLEFLLLGFGFLIGAALFSGDEQAAAALHFGLLDLVTWTSEFVLWGVAYLLFGFAVLRGGNVLFLTAYRLMVAVVLLIGVAFLLNGIPALGLSLLGMGAAGLLDELIGEPERSAFRRDTFATAFAAAGVGFSLFVMPGFVLMALLATVLLGMFATHDTGRSIDLADWRRWWTHRPSSPP